MDAKGENEAVVPDVNDGMNENPTNKDGSDTEIVDEVPISGIPPKSEGSSSGMESDTINLDWSSECESSQGWSEAEERCQKELHAQLKRHRQELIEILKQHVNLNKSLENQLQLRHEVYGEITTTNPVTSTSSSTLDIDGFSFITPEKIQNFEGAPNANPALVQLAIQTWGSNLPGSSKAPPDHQTFPSLLTPISSPIRKIPDKDGEPSQNLSVISESQRNSNPETFDGPSNKNINHKINLLELPALPFEDFVKEDRYSGDKGKRPLNPKYAYKKGSKAVPKSDPKNRDAEAPDGDARKSPIKMDGRSRLEPPLMNINPHNVPSVQNTSAVISMSNLKMEEDHDEGATKDTARQIIDSAERTVISTDVKPTSIMNGTRSLEDVLTSPKKRHKSTSPEITSRKKHRSDRDSEPKGFVHSNLRESATREGNNSNRPPTVELFQKKNKECLIQ